ncbi:MAG: hypothetical protein V3V08_16805 [Nannocystaceae bacterium]
MSLKWSQRCISCVYVWTPYWLTSCVVGCGSTTQPPPPSSSASALHTNVGSSLTATSTGSPSASDTGSQSSGDPTPSTNGPTSWPEGATSSSEDETAASGEHEANPSLGDLPDDAWRLLHDGSGEIERAYGITDYSGMALDHEAGRLLLFGGGHAAAYMGNGVWAFSLEDFRWHEIGVSDSPDHLLECANYQESYPGAVFKAGSTSIDEAKPTSRHTYDTVEWLTNVGQFAQFGGFGHDEISGCSPTAFSPLDMWLFDPDHDHDTSAGNGWTYATAHTFGEAGACATYSDAKGRLYAWTPGGFFAYDPITNNWDSSLQQPGIAGSTHCAMTASGGEGDTLYVLGHDYPSSGALWRYEIGADRWTQLDPSGDTPPATGGWGLAYDGRNDVLLAVNRADASCWTLIYHPEDNRFERVALEETGFCGDNIFGRFKYDRVNNVAFLAQYVQYSVAIWAYRYKSTP